MELDTRPEANTNLLRPKSRFICGVVEGFYGKPWTSEQRKDLFQKMKKWGMDSYLYAPKDDYKHRSFWRELYAVEETEHLSSLIVAAKESDINFIYAISPGLDITYSNSKDVNALKRKLEQVKQLECRNFAILFDDIEPEMSKSDKEMFKSFAHAQVAVANEIHQFINPDRFLFCPTEYCAARAVPSVKSSEYLKTIGAQLDLQFDILWTGGKVVSKDITLESIEEIAEAISRPPLLWDNLHANDYDQKRIFLGPYAGRSPRIIQRIRGVLTNPNCEYGSNFIAIHTLAQWARCSEDAPVKPSSINSDIKLEIENNETNGIPENLSPHVYHPISALKIALQEWLEEFKKHKEVRVPAAKPSVTPSVPLQPPVATCSAIATTTLTTSSAMTFCHPADMPTFSSLNYSGSDSTSAENGSNTSNSNQSNQLMNSLVADDKIICTPDVTQSSINGSTEINRIAASRNSATGLEPMDTASIPSSPSTSWPEKMNETLAEALTKSSSEDVLMEAHDDSQTESAPASVMTLDSDVEGGICQPLPATGSNVPTTAMQDEEFTDKSLVEDDENSLTVEDLHLLCDLFYLPYDHGSQGTHLLKEFQWLKANGNLVVGILAEDDAIPEVIEWQSRARDFEELTKNLLKVVGKLNLVANRELLFELYPYMWDMKGIVALLNSYVKWLAVDQNNPASTAPPNYSNCKQYSPASLPYQLLSLYNNRD